MQLTRIGPFALEETLDGLADSNVLRGVHVERKMAMAIKLVPRDVVNRPMRGSTFAADVKVLQQLVHPGIVRYHGGAVDQGQPYLALELVQGESLRDRLNRRGRLPWEMTVDVIDAVCEALQFAHEKGVVHQRITPTRILIAPDETVKLGGFDCIWTLRDEIHGLRVPMECAYYLAPEVFRGKQSATLPTCDLFSLGVILYECLSGEQPWPASSPADLVQARRAAPAPRVSTKVLDCPVWLDRLVAKLLAVDRKERLTTAEEAHRTIVNAKRKVASGMGATQQQWSGLKGALASDQDRSAIQKLRRQLPKQRDNSPVYERAWFLGVCLLAVISLGVWALWPPSEDALFANAKEWMNSEDSGDWQKAEDIYLESFRARFPNTKYAVELAEFDRKVAVHDAEARLNNNKRLNKEPQSEAERRFREAQQYEQFGDRLTAWNKYEALIGLFVDSKDKYDKAFVELARARIGRIKNESGSTEDRSILLEKQLDRAEQLHAEGKRVEARVIVDSIIELYGNNQELIPLVDRARDLITNWKVSTPTSN